MVGKEVTEKTFSGERWQRKQTLGRKRKKIKGGKNRDLGEINIENENLPRVRVWNHRGIMNGFGAV